MSLYEILGVTKNASEQDIKRAYRSLALRYHPDRNNGDIGAGEKFKEMNSAYEILGSVDKRKQYDLQSSPSPIPFSGEFPVSGDDMQNIFNMVFGGQRPGFRTFSNDANILFQQQIHKPTPIFKTVQISMEQCFTGCSIPIEIERWVMETPTQRNTERETVYINIPSGIDNNEFIILRNQGNVIDENVKGDIKIAIEISNNTLFKRSGLDLYFNIQISLKNALCGFTYEITLINGKKLCLTNMANPSIIKPDFKQIVPQKGLTRGEQTGNLILKFIIDFPDKLTPQQLLILNEVL